MTAITAALPPASMDSKALLDKAEGSYRFGKFPDAYRDCKCALERDEFASWKDKKKHDAIKSLIRYGYYANGRSEVLKWLQKRKDSLPDYPLHVCEWVAAEMSSISKKRLQYVRSDTITASTDALRDILDSSSTSSNTKVADMCMDVLVHRVMIPHENYKDAEEAIRDYSSKISAECQTDLQNAVHRERTAAAKAAAATPAKQVWRTVMPPLRPAGMAAPRDPPAHSTPAWLPQAQPGSLLDRVVTGLRTALSREGLSTYVLPAVAAGILIWAFGPKQQPRIDTAAVTDPRPDF